MPQWPIRFQILVLAFLHMLRHPSWVTPKQYIDYIPGPIHLAINLPDIGHLAKWSVSSHKFGFGAECLRDDDPDTFWQYVQTDDGLPQWLFDSKLKYHTLCTVQTVPNLTSLPYNLVKKSPSRYIIFQPFPFLQLRCLPISSENCPSPELSLG